MSLNVGTVQATARLDMRRYSQGIKRMRTEGNRASASVGKGVEGIGTKLRSVAFIAQTVFASALVMGARRAVREYSELESSLIRIETLVGLSTKEVQGFTKELNNLSTAVGKSPKELADALFFITSAGNRGAQAMELLEISAKASAVGLGEAKTVAHLASSAIAAYGKDNLNASQAVNILLGAVREGKAEAADMAGSLGQVLPIASEMGVTFDQIAAATAAMTRTGTDASQAATAMRAILVGLLNPSEQAERALEGMGTSSANLRKELREKGLISVLGFLRKQMEENERAMSDVFPNVRALAGALDLMGSNAEDNIQIFERLTETTGLLDRAFQRTTESAEFMQQSLGASFRQTIALIGQKLEPAYTGLTATLANFFQTINTGMNQATRRQAQFNTGLKSVFDLLEKDVSDMGLGELRNAYGFVATEIDKLKDQFEDISKFPAQEQALNQLTGILDTLAIALHDVSSGVESMSQQEIDIDTEPLIDWNEEARKTLERVAHLRTVFAEPMPHLFDENMFPPILSDLAHTEELIDNLIEGWGELDNATIEFSDDLTEATGAARFFSTTLGDGLANVLSQAQSVEGALKNIIRQLASRAFVTGLMALFGGGLGGVSFGKAMFGGTFHTGGIVGGTGEKTIIAKGGEGVFTPSQMKAMGSSGGGGTANIIVHIKGDTRLRANDLRYVIDEQIRQTVRLT